MYNCTSSLIIISVLRLFCETFVLQNIETCKSKFISSSSALTAMAEFAQLKVELAQALEDKTGSKGEQISLAQRGSELVSLRFDHRVSF